MGFENKLVAVLNKDIEESGILMNALAHMTLGLGASLSNELLRLDDYIDANDNRYPNISQMPFIILRGKSGEIRKTVVAAREQGIAHGIYLNTMRNGTYVEQINNTRKTDEPNLIYYGCVLFGPWDKVSELTRKLSLWK